LDLLSSVAVRAGKSYADGGPHLAGAIGFRVLFSIFPLLIVLGGLLGIVINAANLQTDFVDAIVDAIPLDEEGQDTFRTLLEGATGTLTSLGLLGIVGIVWSASGMMGAIRFGLNRAFGVSLKRPFLRGKLLDVGLVFAVGVLIGLALGLAVTVRLLSAFAGDTLDEAGLSGVFTWLIGLFVPAVLVFVAVAVLYRVVPARRPRWRTVLPAAALVGVAYALLQNLFALYLSYFGNYNAVYGSLGATIAFLFFVYLSSSLFLLGAYAAALSPVVRGELERGAQREKVAVPIRERIWMIVRSLFVYQSSRDEDEAEGEEEHEEEGERPAGDEREL
jgi:membrane protein